MPTGREPGRSMYLIFPVFPAPLVAPEFLLVAVLILVLALPVLVMVLDLPLVVLALVLALILPGCRDHLLALPSPLV